ncbi:MAG: hypothetical protein ACOY3Y_12200 [Acidobacteriota bacterium]
MSSVKQKAPSLLEQVRGRVEAPVVAVLDFIFGLRRRIVKAHADAQAVCPRCKRAVDPMESWVWWRVPPPGAIWHFECLQAARGGTLAPPDPVQQPVN